MRKLALGVPQSDTDLQWVFQSLREIEVASFRPDNTVFEDTATADDALATLGLSPAATAIVTLDFTTSFLLSYLSLDTAAEAVVTLGFTPSFLLGHLSLDDPATALFTLGFSPYFSSNLVINGGMEVSQESGSTAQTGVTSFVYGVDGFSFDASSAAVFTIQQVADAPPGLKNSLKVSVTTADTSIGAGDYAIIEHSIEGPRTARSAWGGGSALSLPIGFWVKAHRAATYSMAAVNSAHDRAYPFNITINAADTWEYKTKTIPGDTTGTWLTTSGNKGLTLRWTLAGGSTFLGTANTWAAANLIGVTGTINGIAATTDTFQLSGVSAIPGTLPIPQSLSTYFIRPYDQELADAQRFYFQSSPGGAGNPSIFFNINSSNLGGAASFPCTMRTAPTITIRNNTTANQLSLVGGGNVTVTAVLGTDVNGFSAVQSAAGFGTSHGQFNFIANSRF